MTEEQWEEDDLVSFLSLATLLLRSRVRITRFALAGVVLAALWAVRNPAQFTSSASFIPEGNDVSRASGLASLAGQFGVQLSPSNQSLSPEFYAKLLKSPVVLLAIARDTLRVNEMGEKRIGFADLFDITGSTPELRDERGVRVLKELVKPTSDKLTGIVSVSVSTKWPSVSNAIVTALINGINDFNLKTRQGQASAERQFVEKRLAVANADLRQAEDRLEDLVENNRQITSSPALQLLRDRLMREVTMKQSVYTSLAQSYEQVRIREVRDTPIISMLEPPSWPALPNSSGRLVALLTGLVLGGFVGAIVVYIEKTLKLRRQEKDPEAIEFLGTVAELKAGLIGRIQTLRTRVRGT